jgi:hypothetical protein
MPAGSDGTPDDRDESRHETKLERIDRNWAELLQELRVTQTGVQLLTAFLLSLPFQQRFETISHAQRVIYLVVVLLSIGATGFLVMPVAVHRAVFRKHEKDSLVRVADLMAKLGLALLALAVSGVVLLIFDVVVGAGAGIGFGLGTLGVLLVLWAVVPLIIRMRGSGDTNH